MFGHRPDGKRVKSIDPVMRITPYIMPMRCDAQVFLKHRANMEILSRYIRTQKREKDQQFSYMQIIVAAYVRAISANPEVNRFIMNKQLFARNNCSAAFTMLKNPNDADQGEAVVKIKFDLTDTLYDVRDRMTAAVETTRGEASSPRVVALVRLLDRYGLAPAVLMDELPFYVGMYITNTASIGLHDVNHHLYNWGNVGLFLGMGTPERITEAEDGQTRVVRYLPIGITADERVCSGAHYARFFSDVKRYLEHPELLETPPEHVRYDEGCEYHEPKPANS